MCNGSCGCKEYDRACIQTHSVCILLALISINLWSISKVLHDVVRYDNGHRQRSINEFNAHLTNQTMWSQSMSHFRDIQVRISIRMETSSTEISSRLSQVPWTEYLAAYSLRIDDPPLEPKFNSLSYECNPGRLRPPDFDSSSSKWFNPVTTPTATYRFFLTYPDGEEVITDAVRTPLFKSDPTACGDLEGSDRDDFFGFRVSCDDYSHVSEICHVYDPTTRIFAECPVNSKIWAGGKGPGSPKFVIRHPQDPTLILSGKTVRQGRRFFGKKKWHVPKNLVFGLPIPKLAFSVDSELFMFFFNFVPFVLLFTPAAIYLFIILPIVCFSRIRDNYVTQGWGEIPYNRFDDNLQFVRYHSCIAE